jgi:hypothetical protein
VEGIFRSGLEIARGIDKNVNSGGNCQIFAILAKNSVGASISNCGGIVKIRIVGNFIVRIVNLRLRASTGGGGAVG